ncbi:MAG: 30S ribosomal protein S1 [Clostridiales bacterium]|nr:30S ribosomal protein S1 [Clostridiales bacterium]
MEYQRFMPEGWKIDNFNFTKQSLDRAISTGEILQGKVSKCDSNYNLYVNLGNEVTGIIPREEIEAVNIDETGYPKPNICTSKVNKYVQFKVRSIDSRNNYILSRKDVGKEALNWITNELQEGMVVNGIVKSIQPYGVFVEIGGGIVGLLHIEDISIARIKTPAERLKIGQKINVIIKCIDKKMERVILTYKELLGTWEDNIKDFEEGKVVEGIVRETEKSKNGIFIELKPNLVGMAEYKEGIEYGQNVDVYIKKIIPEKRKVKLLII